MKRKVHNQYIFLQLLGVKGDIEHGATSIRQKLEEKIRNQYGSFENVFSNDHYSYRDFVYLFKRDLTENKPLRRADIEKFLEYERTHNSKCYELDYRVEVFNAMPLVTRKKGTKVYRRSDSSENMFDLVEQMKKGRGFWL